MGSKVTLLDAIENVLCSAGGPLHVSDIRKRLAEAGLWEWKTKTPEASISARLAEYTKNHGDGARFIRVKPNIYALGSASRTEDG